ncbi:YcaO-like family protein [Nocardia arthritidis]|nr:YcaO-like family protein [Nocardia arthritidis]
MIVSDQRLDLSGTYRARLPEHTWELISAVLPDYGITRVADVTGFDFIGIPVYMATRPLSETLTVSQGKGATPLLAKLSAVMECIELQHAEHPDVPTVRAAAEQLDLRYPLGALPLRIDAAVIRSFTLDWCPATGLASGRATFVPRDLVDLSFGPESDWRPAIFHASSSGLASGNTRAEALLHALYELVERDVVAGLVATGRDHRIVIDVTTIEHPYCRRLVDLLVHSGALFEVALVPNRYRLPTAVAYVWSADFPLVCGGSGTHSDPAVAVARALTEAAQSRLTAIVGTRDDLEIDSGVMELQVAPNPPLRTDGTAWTNAVAGHGFRPDNFSEELETVVLRIAEHTGYEPLSVELSTRPDIFTVVRVVAPGLSFRHRGSVPR